MNQYGPELILAVLFCLILLPLLYYVYQLKGRCDRLEKRYSALLKSDGIDFGEVISRQHEDMQTLLAAYEDDKARIDAMREDVGYSFTRVGLSYYEAFSQVGAPKSFSLCLLNAFDSGLMMTSLNSRNSAHNFCKQIRNGKSEIPLSDEEYNALQQALAQAPHGERA